MHERNNTRPKPVVLLILDGLGIDVPNKGNAVTLADTPNLDRLWPKYPHTSLQASEHYVGLPQGVKGNSEVGHMTIGAGRLLKQEITRIDEAIDNGEFYQNDSLLKVAQHVKHHNSSLHFIGLVSDGRVHSSDEHLFACLEFAKKQDVSADKVFVHAFTDGRDTDPTSAKQYLAKLAAKMDNLGIGRLASLCGRFYGMDRDERWLRTEKAYKMIVQAEGRTATNFEKAIDDAYAKDETDEFIQPYVLKDKSGDPVGYVKDNDAVVCFNYRADRSVQISKAFEDEEFTQFDRTLRQNVLYAGFSNYQKGSAPSLREREEYSAKGESDLVKKIKPSHSDRDEGDYETNNIEKPQPFPELQIFPPPHPHGTLGEVLAKHRFKQLRIAESEKYPHVTYFFNNRHQGSFTGETRIEIPSPQDVETYDKKPEMSNYELTERLIQEIESEQYDFIFVNFALTDMVGHTGVLEAGVKSVEVADECLGKLVEPILSRGGELIVTADHGNVEEMINLSTGEPDTEHSLNPVPLIYITNNPGDYPDEVATGTLGDLAPTILGAMSLPQPEEMDGRDLFGPYRHKN